MYTYMHHKCSKFFPSQHTTHCMRAYMYSSVLTISLSDILSLLDKESNIVRGFENRPVYTNGSARSSLEHETLGQKERGGEGEGNLKNFSLLF